MLRVLTIDDNRLFLEVFNDLLGRFPDIRLVGSAQNGAEGLAAAAELSPDLVFVDLKMPGLSGLEVADRLRRQQPSVRVVVMSLLDDEEFQRSVSAAGAERCLGKRELFNQLPAILQRTRPPEAAW